MSEDRAEAATPEPTEAQWKLVRSVERLIHKLVHDLAPHAAEDFRKDLASAGRSGAIVAASRFDPGRGVRFATYAVPYISGEIRRARDKEGRQGKLHRRAREAGVGFLAQQPEAGDVVRDPPEVNRERAHALVEALLTAMYAGVASAPPDPETAMIQKEMHEALRAAVAKLEPAQQDVVRLRYDEDMELKEAGAALGISERTTRRRQEDVLDSLALKLLRFWPEEEG